MKKRFGCISFLFFLFLAFILLYFLVGEGKTLILKRVYPIKYQEYVEKYSNEYNIDKNLIYSIIKIESNFKEDAISVAGAKGLMQLMDNTAIDCNKKAGFGYQIPSDLFLPEKNIRLGCYYMSSLLAEYKDAELAVIAYNGGTGNVKKWLSDPQLSDGKGKLLKIPYTETQKYVKKVFRTFKMYNRLYKTNE